MESFGFGDITEKIDVYKQFWNRTNKKKPLIGYTFKSWFPLSEYKASSAWEKKFNFLSPEMIDPDDFLEDLEGLLYKEKEIRDDIIRGACPGQFVPWLSAAAGCRLRIMPGNILPIDGNLSWTECHEAVDNIENSEWYRKYLSFVSTLNKRSGGSYPVSYGTIVGPLDLAVKLRGHEQIVMDMIDEPDKCRGLLTRLNRAFLNVSKEVLARIRPFYGGYYDAVFCLWAPGTLVRLQEDAMAVLSPDLYIDFIKPLDVMAAGEFEYSIMHLHTNSRFVLEHILAIQGLTAIQLNHEPFSVPLIEMVPYYQLIQKHKNPLVLRGDFSEQDAFTLMSALEPAGLLILNLVDDFTKLEKLRAAYGTV